MKKEATYNFIEEDEEPEEVLNKIEIITIELEPIDRLNIKEELEIKLAEQAMRAV